MSALSRLRARIEKRTEELRGAHLPKPPGSLEAARAELAMLGAYVSGEPRARTLRRSFVQRWIGQTPRGKYAETIPLPGSDDAARTELRVLGPYVLGEPGRVSRRRAAIVRARPGLGAYVARLELEALGPASEGEPWAITQRREVLYRRAHIR